MDSVLDILTATVESPWVYLLVFVVVGLDSLLPIVPSETVLITAAAFSVAGTPAPLGLVLVAAVGAVVGDFAAHLVGRGGGRLLDRWTRSPRAQRLMEGTEGLFARRGGSVLIAGRFVPGGRTATTLASGVLEYPRSRFLVFDGLGALAWSVYSTGIGVVGGAVFEDRPLLGVALGIGFALVLTGVAEITRRLVASRRTAASGPRTAHRGQADWTASTLDMAS